MNLMDTGLQNYGDVYLCLLLLYFFYSLKVKLQRFLVSISNCCSGVVPACISNEHDNEIKMLNEKKHWLFEAGDITRDLMSGLRH